MVVAPPDNWYSIGSNAKVGLGVFPTQIICASSPMDPVKVIISFGLIVTTPEIGVGVVKQPKAFPIKL